MSELIGVALGGLIGVTGSLGAVWITHQFEERRRRKDRLGELFRLLGEQAALELPRDKADDESLYAKYLKKAQTAEAEAKKDPAFVDLSIGYFAASNAEIARLRQEIEQLREESGH